MLFKKGPRPPARELIREASVPATPPARLEALARERRLEPYVAANPAAPAGLLRQLARSKEKEVRRAVAANPNTPPELLAELAAAFPVALAANPVLPLLLIERPDFLRRLGPHRLHTIVRQLDAPRDLLLLIREHVTDLALYVGDEARWHVNLRGELDADWRPGAEEAIWQLRRWRLVARYLAPHPETPEPVLWRIAGLDDWRLRRLVARNPNIPPALQELLAEDQDWSVRYDLARNPRLDPALRERMAAGPDEVVRRIIARRAAQENTAQPAPGDARIHLGSSILELSTVLSYLRHDATLPGLLVATALLYPLPNHPWAVNLEDLHSWIVRLLLVHHPRLRLDQLRRLRDDSHALVRAAALERLHANLGRSQQ